MYYLVQRCKFRTEVKRGVVRYNSLTNWISLDYMGSAEYEFGAVPNSLATMRTREIREASFTIVDTAKSLQFSMVALTTLSESDFAQFAYEAQLDYNGTRRCKESTYLRASLNGELHTNLWYDIEAATFFCQAKDQQRLSNLLRVLRCSREQLPEVHPFDLVVAVDPITGPVEGKVAGINADDSITVKLPHRKKLRVFPVQIVEINGEECV